MRNHVGIASELPTLQLNRRLATMIAPEVLLQGYRLGVFPMAMEDGAIEWFSPDPRGILPLEEFHIPHALQKVIRKKVSRFASTPLLPLSSAGVLDAPTPGSTDEIIRSYTRLHELGQAHSVEAWAGRKLVGGLYGVSAGGAFFGESMFHDVTDASKVALCALVERLRAQRFLLLDTQWLTPHLKRFGGIEISRAQYMHLLARAVALTRKF